MAYTTVTYTFSNSTTADATQVNQNFTDLINGLSDGTKDLSVSALTAAGTATLNGNVNLGNSSSDDLTITAALAGSVSVKTNATYNVGSSTLGLLSIYLGGASSYTVRLLASASQSATYTLTLPTTAGTKGYIPYNGGSGTLSWAPYCNGVNAVSDAYTILDDDGYKIIAVTCGASNRTITLPTAADNTGREITITKVDTSGYYVEIDGESSETINGLASLYLGTQYDSITVVCTGSAWYCKGNLYSSFYSTTAPSNAGTSPSGIVQATRVGNTVTVSAKVVTGSGSPTTPTWSAILPTWARPNASVSFWNIYTPGNDYAVALEADSSGNVVAYRAEWDTNGDYATVNWSTSTTLYMSVTFTIN